MKRVLIHVKAQVGAREEAFDFECSKTGMWNQIDLETRRRGLAGPFNRIIVFIYPTLETQLQEGVENPPKASGRKRAQSKA